MALINRKLAKQVETVFLMSSEEYSYLSSTIIKDVANHGGSLTEFLHPEVARRLQARIRSVEVMKLAARAGRIAPSPTLAMAATAKAMAAQGIDVDRFFLGRTGLRYAGTGQSRGRSGHPRWVYQVHAVIWHR